MAIVLTDDEAALVSANRKSDRPTWYNANIKKNVKISEDFEAFLILSPKQAKSQGVSWISTFASMQEPDVVRSNLLTEWASNESSDANALYNLANAALAPFKKWRDSFSAGKFGDTAEVGLLVNDLSYLIDEKAFLANNYEHNKVVAAIQTKRIADNQMSEDRIKESQSWSGPLLSY